MSSQDAKRAADAGSPAGRLTRRSLLRGAATAGAAGLAATAMGAAAGPALASASQPAVPDQAHGQHEPIVVHVRDARSGDIEVFAGTRQAQLRDKDLAARIARAIG
jgi:hypothetical protein